MKEIRIVDFEPQYKQAFRDLNEAWISKYFTMEEADYKALDHPEEYILNKGGHISIALMGDQPIGACALIKMEDSEYDYELAKMAVSPLAQGKGIGKLLGQTIVEKAKELGASSIYLESNSVLKPALALYKKLGFEEVNGKPTPYSRCDVQMEMVF